MHKTIVRYIKPDEHNFPNPVLASGQRRRQSMGYVLYKMFVMSGFTSLKI